MRRRQKTGVTDCCKETQFDCIKMWKNERNCVKRNISSSHMDDYSLSNTREGDHIIQARQAKGGQIDRQTERRGGEAGFEKFNVSVQNFQYSFRHEYSIP